MSHGWFMCYRCFIWHCMSCYHVSWMVYVLQVVCTKLYIILSSGMMVMVYVLQVLCTALYVILSCLMGGLCVTGAVYSVVCHFIMSHVWFMCYRCSVQPVVSFIMSREWFMCSRCSVQRGVSFYHVSWMVYVLQVLCTAWSSVAAGEPAL